MTVVCVPLPVGVTRRSRVQCDPVCWPHYSHMANYRRPQLWAPPLCYPCCKLADVSLTGNDRQSFPRAIIFDPDDTILDDSGAMEACWQEACSGAAEHLDGVGVAALRRAIDARREVYWADPDRHREGRMDLRAATRLIVNQALDDLGMASAEAARAISDTYRDLR